AERAVLLRRLRRARREQGDVVEVVLDLGVRLDEAEAKAFGADVEIRLSRTGPLDGGIAWKGFECGIEARDPQGDVLQGPALARRVGREERQLAATRVRAHERELLRPVDHVHPEMLRDEVGDRVAIGYPVGNVVELRRIHSPTVPTP